MKKASSLYRLALYGLLGVLGFVFLTPFLWMLSTSLKPLEQTMSLPPSWIPLEHRAVVDGVESEVILDEVQKTAGYVVIALEGERKGQRLFLARDELRGREQAFKILQTTEAGWRRVTEKRPPSEVGKAPAWSLVPESAIRTRVGPRWRNFQESLSLMGAGAGGRPGEGPGFWLFLGNSLFVCVLGSLGTVLSNAIVAYGFARLRWRGREAFFALTLSTMMVPFPVLMVPLYGVFRDLGWIGTLLPLWVPAWFGSAFNIFLMRQFFRGIPEELSEAARMDGCSEWRIFWSIILPLSKPVLVTAALFHFLFAWNDFLGPLLYLTRRESYTLALALQSYSSQVGGVQWHYLMAAALVTTLPILVLFFFAQKTFIRGISTTGSKS